MKKLIVTIVAVVPDNWTDDIASSVARDAYVQVDEPAEDLDVEWPNNVNFSYTLEDLA